ncbi:MAG: ATP-binding protein [Cytophagales bacterium]|nr:ATP-binding protein [Bernardetiaceae bacterium]MDW8205987.1 ATP-binding protein [Cytophagales bacterium]
MITKIYIHGFKSFYNFEMEFSPLTVIAGLNASGKSNLFDALMLLSKLAEVDNIKKAFKEQRGEFSELFTQLAEGRYADEMRFGVEMLVNKTIRDAWGNESKLKYTRLRYELTIRRITTESGIDNLIVAEESLTNLKHNQDKWLNSIPKAYREIWRPKVLSGRRSTPYMYTDKSDIPTVIVPQDGGGGNKRKFPLRNSTRTVLSTFDTVDFPHVLAAREEMRNWRFLQLNPSELRKPTPKDTGDDKISTTGEHMAGALFRMHRQNAGVLKDISRKLQSFLPEFIAVKVEDDKENKQYIIHLEDRDKKTYSSRVLSEGTLRILALCILAFDEQYSGLLCFEEPENGVHPQRMKDMMQLLKELSTDFKNEYEPLRQVIVNTHSPILLQHFSQSLNDSLTSIWYAQMKNIITDTPIGRSKISATEILPVSESIQFEAFPISEAKQKIALATVKEYLATAISQN